jgi:hypothetical protein
MCQSRAVLRIRLKTESRYKLTTTLTLLALVKPSQGNHRTSSGGGKPYWPLSFHRHEMRSYRSERKGI